MLVFLCSCRGKDLSDSLIDLITLVLFISNCLPKYNQCNVVTSLP